MSRSICAGLALLALIPMAAAGDDWPAWRGPRGDGVFPASGAPVRWTATDNVAWKTPIPGIGHSSPIVVGDRIFLTSCRLEKEERVLLCLDRKTGKTLWERVVLVSPLERRHKLNSYASSTPASDGKHVYVSFLRLRKKTASDGPPSQLRPGNPYPPHLIPEFVVTCYTVDGAKLWEKVPGRFYSPHGFCSSPLLHEDLVILNGDQDAEAWLVALDRKTGAERWRVNRPNRTRSYCAPLIVEVGGRTQMVLTGSLCVTSYDPDTGKLLWQIDGPTEQFVASPVYGAGLLFITAGYPEYHNMAIRPDGIGNVTHSHVQWHEKNVAARRAAYVPSPIAYDRWFYVVSDLGYVSCFEAKTGKRLWMERLGRHHSASPVLAGGNLYFIDDDGVAHVLKAGPTFAVVARNDLGESCYASPAIADGQLFIRTLRHLYCIGNPRSAGGSPAR